MSEKNTILDCLEQSPGILRGLVSGIPKESLKVRRVAGKWSIHEHVCHLAEAEDMILKRFQKFKELDNPKFQPYLPGDTISVDHLLRLDLNQELGRYESTRKQLIDLVSTFDESKWKMPVSHGEYTEYSALILLRHTLMHDHFHMYRIEELWLTKDEFLQKTFSK